MYSVYDANKTQHTFISLAHPPIHILLYFIFLLYLLLSYLPTRLYDLVAMWCAIVTPPQQDIESGHTNTAASSLGLQNGWESTNRVFQVERSVYSIQCIVYPLLVHMHIHDPSLFLSFPPSLLPFFCLFLVISTSYHTDFDFITPPPTFPSFPSHPLTFTNLSYLSPRLTQPN